MFSRNASFNVAHLTNLNKLVKKLNFANTNINFIWNVENLLPSKKRNKQTLGKQI